MREMIGVFIVTVGLAAGCHRQAGVNVNLPRTARVVRECQKVTQRYDLQVCIPKAGGEFKNLFFEVVVPLSPDVRFDSFVLVDEARNLGQAFADFGDIDQVKWSQISGDRRVYYIPIPVVISEPGGAELKLTVSTSLRSDKSVEASLEKISMKFLPLRR